MDFILAVMDFPSDPGHVTKPLCLSFSSCKMAIMILSCLTGVLSLLIKLLTQ